MAVLASASGRNVRGRQELSATAPAKQGLDRDGLARLDCDLGLIVEFELAPLDTAADRPYGSRAS